jgi:hypothetical protein
MAHALQGVPTLRMLLLLGIQAVVVRVLNPVAAGTPMTSSYISVLAAANKQALEMPVAQEALRDRDRDLELAPGSVRAATAATVQVLVVALARALARLKQMMRMQPDQELEQVLVLVLELVDRVVQE